MSELRPLRTSLTIYPDYWLAAIGKKVRETKFFVFYDLKDFWVKFDSEMKHWPSQDFWNDLYALFWDPYPKSAAWNFIQYIGAPVLALLILITIIGPIRRTVFCICCCGCLCPSSKSTGQRSGEVLDEYLVEEEQKKH
jgi:hypothetical protein